jgi:hypothetical protein
MSDWESSTYGNPCRECDFDCTISIDDAVLLVSRLPNSMSELVSGTTGGERRPDLAWSVGAYVCHVADNLRIWAERLIGVVEGGPLEVGGYDEKQLASARNYERIPLQAALWSLRRSVEDWLSAVQRSPRVGTVMLHPERGELTLDDVTLSNAHDAFHHCWDIRTTLDAAGA